MTDVILQRISSVIRCSGSEYNRDKALRKKTLTPNKAATCAKKYAKNRDRHDGFRNFKKMLD
jgi:hypothetical protein